MALARRDLVIANDMISAAIAEGHALRTLGMAERPAVGTPARIVYAVALDGDALKTRRRRTDGAHTGIAIDADHLAVRERLRPARHDDRLRDREGLAPRARGERHRRLSCDADLNVVCCRRRQVYDAAAAFVVTRVVPHRQRVAPRRIAEDAVLSRAAVRAW